jgi:threonine aldolase
MAWAVVGDEQRGEDPTVLALEQRIADLLGLAESVFLPTATMANQIALRALSNPGEEVVAESAAHIFRSEAAGPAVHSRLAMCRVEGRDGIFSGDDLREAVTRDGDAHRAQSTVVSIENTHNASGGRVWSPQQHRELVAVARECGLKVHLDGARLLNACAALNVPADAFGRSCDTVTVCLSKGLGAPAGAVLACSSEYVSSVRRLKHVFGGAMRQAGILAGAGLFALDHNVERLPVDHDNASRLAHGLREVGVRVVNVVQTNIVLFDATSLGSTRDHALNQLESVGVLCSKGSSADIIRAVSHLNIDKAMIYEAVCRIRSLRERQLLGISETSGV